MRRSPALRSDIAAAERECAAERARAAAEHQAARRASTASGTTYVTETPEERKVRLERQQADRARAKARRRANPGQAFVDEHVTREAQANGDYARDTVPGPNIIKAGKETPTSLTVVKNRGGTTVERWLSTGALDRRQAEAIAWYCRMWALFHGSVRVTANWSLVASFRGGTTDFDTFARTQLHAKRMLAWLDDEVFFAPGISLTHFNVWQNVVLFDEPAGVAGGRLGYTSKQAEAVAKETVRSIADAIADALNLGRQAPAAEWIERA